MREECRDLLEQIGEKTVRIDARTVKIKVLAAEADTARRLQTIPGIGPLTALAVEAFAPPMRNSDAGGTSPLGSALFHVNSPQVAKNGSGAFPTLGSPISEGC